MLVGLPAVIVVGWSVRSGTAPARAAGDEGDRLTLAGQPTERGQGADVERLLAGARSAIARGTLREAEMLLRHAIEIDAGDQRAPAMLRGLYENEGLTLLTDEEAVRSTLAELGPGYHVNDTKHFVIVSDCDPIWRARREALLERTYHEVMRAADQFGIQAYPPASKLLCVMMHDHDAYQAFGRANDDVQAHWVAGYYAGGSNRMVLYDDETGPTAVDERAKLDDLEAQAADARAKARRTTGKSSAALRDRAAKIERFVREERARLERDTEVRSEAKTIHEAVHLIAFNCGLQVRSRRYPMWITEGLATGFETDDPERSFGPDRAYEQREEEFDRMREQGRLERLRSFAGRLRASDDPDKAEAEYAESYALFRHLFRFHRRELAALLTDIARQPPGEIPSERQVELFERRFGPVDRVGRRWLRLEDR